MLPSQGLIQGYRISYKSLLWGPVYGGRRWATNLGGGNTQNGRDSNSKRLGVKLGHGISVLSRLLGVNSIY